ncbi:MAG: hypothetical protein AB1521_11600 [Bacteroidota bacterium]
MKQKIFLVFVVNAFILINSCTDSITDSEPSPGRRDYVWTADTLNAGFETLYLMRIWGSSPEDVWAIASSSWSATTIWHYNGVQWHCDSIPRFVQPAALFGYSSNEVWLGNINSTIWRYDGAQWLRFGEYKVEGYSFTAIEDFGGLSRDNLYAVGYTELLNANKWKAILMHYNGRSWGFINVPETKAAFETIAVEDKNGVVVMSGTIYDPSGFVPKVYCWDGNELLDLPYTGPGYTFVTKVGNEIFVSVGSRIYKYNNKQLVLWKDNTGTNIYGRLWCGRSRNDFFIEGSNGIYHYNGTDYVKLFETNFSVDRGMIFEKDVFFIAYNHWTGKNIIIHGKLKDE